MAPQARASIPSPDPALSGPAAEAIKGPDRKVYLSAVSAWEISIKYGLGRLPLPEDPATLVPRLRGESGIQDLGLTEAAVFQILKLPSLHRDPFDRMLICQAIEHSLTLVTPDEAVRQYPVRTLW